MNIVDMFEALIPTDAFVISAKLNIRPDYDISLGTPLLHIKNYYMEKGAEIVACTAGIHENGRNAIPHYHFHMIVRNHVEEGSGMYMTRKRYFEKNGLFLQRNQLSIQQVQIDNTKPRWQALAYPLKEAKLVSNRCLYNLNNEIMHQSYLDFLKEVGNRIYNEERAINQRREACIVKKMNALADLEEIAMKVKHVSMENFVEYMERNYIDTLALEDYPDPKNYKINLQKIGRKLGLIKSFYYLN